MTGFPETLWQSLPMPAFLICPDDTIQMVNPAGEGFLNTSARQIAGTSVFDTLVMEFPIDTQMQRVRADQASLAMTDINLGGPGTAPVTCNLQLAPVVEMPGHVLLLIEPRLLAERLGRSLSAKTAVKSAIGMAEMLAHEIKNPLAGITGAAQLLSMNLSAKDQELTDLIVSESRRIVKLLDQVEQFGNLQPPKQTEVNLHDLLDRARKSAQVGFAAHMEVIEDYDPSLPPIYVDSDQMLQVFLNLLKNAAEAAGQTKGQIRIRTFYDPALRLRNSDGPASLPLNVEFIDNGPGLPPDIASNIFEPFVSGRENGTGLGLALVSKIVADHQGWITVDSRPGHTSFCISLPRAPKQAAAD